MKTRIVCQDKYEAQKLASLIFLKKGKETFITEIINIVDNELVVKLKDKSAHSVVLKDNKQVENFADFIQSVLEDKDKITGAEIFEDEIEILKE